jgi:hypothetical protein
MRSGKKRKRLRRREVPTANLVLTIEHSESNSLRSVRRAPRPYELSPCLNVSKYLSTKLARREA